MARSAAKVEETPAPANTSFTVPDSPLQARRRALIRAREKALAEHAAKKKRLAEAAAEAAAAVRAHEFFRLQEAQKKASMELKLFKDYEPEPTIGTELAAEYLPDDIRQLQDVLDHELEHVTQLHAETFSGTPPPAGTRASYEARRRELEQARREVDALIYVIDYQAQLADIRERVRPLFNLAAPAGRPTKYSRPV